MVEPKTQHASSASGSVTVVQSTGGACWAQKNSPAKQTSLMQVDVRMLHWFNVTLSPRVSVLICAVNDGHFSMGARKNGTIYVLSSAIS